MYRVGDIVRIITPEEYYEKEGIICADDSAIALCRGLECIITEMHRGEHYFWHKVVAINTADAAKQEAATSYIWPSDYLFPISSSCFDLKEDEYMSVLFQ